MFFLYVVSLISTCFNSDIKDFNKVHMMEYNDIIFVNDGKEILPGRTKSNNKGLPLIQAWCKIFILLKSTCKTSVALFEIQQFLAHILRVGCVPSS